MKSLIERKNYEQNIEKYCPILEINNNYSVVTLCCRQNCDLALPQYTSNIIDVGIQNGGIGHSIPEKITKDEYDIAKMFMTDEEISIWEKCFEEQDDLYVRTENNDKG